MTLTRDKKNEKLTRRLTEIIRAGNLHHAYIIEGSRKSDKDGLAIDFAQAILCQVMPGIGCGTCGTCRKIAGGNHVDVISVTAQESKTGAGWSVKVKDINETRARLMKKPYDGERNIAIIHHADAMTPQACNKLLKTLEEPPEGTVIMLLVENIRSLPQTIISRAVHLRMEDAPQEGQKDPVAQAAAELVALIDDGEPYWKLKAEIEKFTKKKNAGREMIYTLLDDIEQIYRDKLTERNDAAIRENVFRAVKAVETARREINENFNTQYALKKMVLTMQ